MGQRHQHCDAGMDYAGTDGSAWLSTLVDTFERATELENVPCDPQTLTAAMARLERPANAPSRPAARRGNATLEVRH